MKGNFIVLDKNWSNGHPFICQKVFDHYGEARKWCQDNYPDLAREDNLPDNFSIRSYTNRGMVRILREIVMNESFERSTYHDLEIAILDHFVKEDEKAPHEWLQHKMKKDDEPISIPVPKPEKIRIRQEGCIAVVKDVQSDATDDEGLWKCDGCDHATWRGDDLVDCGACECPHGIKF